MAPFEKIVVVTRKTELETLVERYNSTEQARFYLEHMNVSFEEYEKADATYRESLSTLQDRLPAGVRSQFVERSYLPTFLFGKRDLVVTLGPDGLVVNTAKYLDDQLIVPFNPDPARIDGILIPFYPWQAAEVFSGLMKERYRVMSISMAKASLNDGQVLYGFNDLFIGRKTHVSAYYQVGFQGKTEDQISSGIIVTTGAGSTGWFRSVVTGAAGVVKTFRPGDPTPAVEETYRFDWGADYLRFAVREPFVSRASSAKIICGEISAGQALEVVSRMPQNGVIFSDGVESDYLEFNSGAVAKINLAEKKGRIVWGEGSPQTRINNVSREPAGRKSPKQYTIRIQRP